MEETLSKNQQNTMEREPEEGFSVTFENGTVIRETTSVNTFVESLKKIGLERIYESQQCPEHTHYKVVDTREKPGKSSVQKKIEVKGSPDYYIYTSLKDEQKIDDLYKISSLFDLNLKIDVYGPAKAPKTKLRVTFPDENLVIEKNTASETFIAAVEHMDLWYVMITGIVLHAEPIVSREMSKRYPKESAPRNGYFVTYHGSTDEKKKRLEEIAERLEKQIIVEIIE